MRREIGIKKGRKAILSYFASLEGERKKLNEGKVLVVGTGGSGKTSLLKRIFGEPFDGKESQTKGIVIRKKQYRKEGQGITLISGIASPKSGSISSF